MRSAGTRRSLWLTTATPMRSSWRRNSPCGSCTLKPGIDSSLSSVPPVCPRPRPDILPKTPPHEATSGASTRVTLSPTPPLECLSSTGRRTALRSRVLPLATIARARATVSRVREPAQDHRHEQRARLVRGHGAVDDAADEGVDAGVVELVPVALPGDDVVDDVHADLRRDRVQVGQAAAVGVSAGGRTEPPVRPGQRAQQHGSRAAPTAARKRAAVASTSSCEPTAAARFTTSESRQSSAPAPARGAHLRRRRHADDVAVARRATPPRRASRTAARGRRRRRRPRAGRQGASAAATRAAAAGSQTGSRGGSSTGGACRSTTSVDDDDVADGDVVGEPAAGVQRAGSDGRPTRRGRSRRARARPRSSPRRGAAGRARARAAPTAPVAGRPAAGASAARQHQRAAVPRDGRRRPAEVGEPELALDERAVGDRGETGAEDDGDVGA